MLSSFLTGKKLKCGKSSAMWGTYKIFTIKDTIKDKAHSFSLSHTPLDVSSVQAWR